MKHLTCLLATLAYAVPAAAQDADAGGMRLTLGIEQRLKATTDSALDDDTTDPGWQGDTLLTLDFLTETRSETVSFDVSTGLRFPDGDGMVANPRAALRYSRKSAGAKFEAGTTWTRTDIAFLRDITDFIAPDGTFDLPENVDDLTGTGTRITQASDVSLRWGQTAPLGFRVAANMTQTSYLGASETLTNSAGVTWAGGLRLTLDPVTEATIDLRRSTLEQGGNRTEVTTTLTTGITRARPLGDVTATLFVARTDDANPRFGLSLGRAYALPTAMLNASLGVTQDNTRVPQVTGRLAYTQALPAGQIDLTASRSIGNRGDRSATILQTAYTHGLTPLTQIRLGFDYARAQDADSDVSTNRLSAGFGYQVSPDWQLNIGLHADQRDNGAAQTHARTTFVTLARSLTYRP